MSQSDAVPSTVDRIRKMLRRDLNVGDEVAIEPDTPLFGGELDLDSLDVLLVVSSVEKEFRIKIPNEDVGRAVFTSVRTLADYIDAQSTAADAEGGGAASATGGSVTTGLAGLLDALPHGEGFRFVTRLESVDVGREGRGVWELNGEESFFAAHFPGRPLVPGVLMSEALAQLSGLVGSQTHGDAGPTDWRGGHLAHVDVRFHEGVTPPASIVLESRLVKMLDTLQHFEVRATVAGRVTAEGRLALNRSGG